MQPFALFDNSRLQYTKDIDYICLRFTTKMEDLLQIHRLMLKEPRKTIRRTLMDEIDWSARLICIKGFRGVGKSTFLADAVSERFGADKSCLYVDLNNFYFTKRRIYNFVEDFYSKGGKVLVLDQIHKYPNWANELLLCYQNFSNLQIIFSSSPVLRIKESDKELAKAVKIYHLKGLSFREYLNYKAQVNYTSYTLDEIIENHEQIATEITQHVKPLAYFDDYLLNGHYPYSINAHSANCSTLLKNINLALEIDITSLNQIELKYLSKLRKLLKILCSEAPFTPNISKLSNEVETSRATIINYLKYLKNARLINLIHAEDEETDSQRKPELVYAHNTNILFAVSPENMDNDVVRKTFFFNQVSAHNKLTSSKKGDFIVNQRYDFSVGGKYHKPTSPTSYATIGRTEIGSSRTIPLWLFGFLY